MSQQILRFPAVQQRVSLSRASLYRLIKLGKFPKPVSLGGRAVGFVESEIENWISTRAQQTNTSTGGTA